MLRAYLEASGYQDYGRFYKLSDQVSGINHESNVQKTMRDYFYTI